MKNFVLFKSVHIISPSYCLSVTLNACKMIASSSIAKKKLHKLTSQEIYAVNHMLALSEKYIFNILFFFPLCEMQ